MGKKSLHTHFACLELNNNSLNILSFVWMLLFHCTKYCTFKDEFYKKIENQIPNITQLPHMQATKKIMNSDNYYLNTQLMKFILRCLSLRNNLLSNESDGTHT